MKMPLNPTIVIKKIATFQLFSFKISEKTNGGYTEVIKTAFFFPPCLQMY